ncbi:hypothetical protein F5Y16DRAFT_304546 [Xylariaceae sp. FL0255]|nr:hypothetical protein F5Y16DRAFT_304546 [Xylariaceae sp. FL0255]
MSTSQPRSFKLFQQLPTELRFQIWEYTIQPRVVRDLFGKQNGKWTVERVPPALQACVESRSLLKQHYTVVTLSHSPQVYTYVNMKIDTVHVDIFILHKYLEENMGLTQYMPMVKSMVLITGAVVPPVTDVVIHDLFRTYPSLGRLAHNASSIEHLLTFESTMMRVRDGLDFEINELQTSAGPYSQSIPLSRYDTQRMVLEALRQENADLEALVQANEALIQASEALFGAINSEVAAAQEKINAIQEDREAAQARVVVSRASLAASQARVAAIRAHPPLVSGYKVIYTRIRPHLSAI